jgi:hypothetical protein
MLRDARFLTGVVTNFILFHLPYRMLLYRITPYNTVRKRTILNINTCTCLAVRNINITANVVFSVQLVHCLFCNDIYHCYLIFLLQIISYMHEIKDSLATQRAFNR